LPRAANKPIVCYVTDRKTVGPSDAFRGAVSSTVEKIRLAAAAEADWVQVREKDLSAKELLALVKQAVSIGDSRVKVIVNDRLDAALAAGAAGVHLGRESVAVSEVVQWCRAGNAPAEFLIGASCHSLDEARQAEAAGANYAFFGPVFDTPSKRAFGAPRGIAQLREVCREIRIPVIAIGGLDQGNAMECLRGGASGIAAIRMFQESTDAEETLREFVKSVHDAEW
jgi:thiamine-phosphate pyrophosphorylase